MKLPRIRLRVLSVGLLLLAGVATADEAQAQLTVDRVILTLKKDQRPVENLIVRNSGSSTLYVTVTPDVMLRPGAPDELRQETEDLLVSPKRFSIEAGGQRTVRVLLKKPFGDSEQVYRVKFIPEDRGFGKDIVAEHSGKKTAVRVLTGIGILIFAEPIDPQPKLEWKRNGDTLAFVNGGNVNIFLIEGKHCKPDGQDCSPLPVDRIYPGNTFSVKAPKDRVVTYRKEVRGEFEDVIIPPVS